MHQWLFSFPVFCLKMLSYSFPSIYIYLKEEYRNLKIVIICIHFLRYENGIKFKQKNRCIISPYMVSSLHNNIEKQVTYNENILYLSLYPKKNLKLRNQINPILCSHLIQIALLIAQMNICQTFCFIRTC